MQQGREAQLFLRRFHPSRTPRLSRGGLCSVQCAGQENDALAMIDRDVGGGLESWAYRTA